MESECSVNMDEVDEDAIEIPIKEELVKEVMQELYRELHSLPLSAAQNAPSSHQAESCGASVSDSASTVMAGFHLVVPTGKDNSVGSSSSSSSLWWWDRGGVGCRCSTWPVVLLGDLDHHEKGMDDSDGGSGGGEDDDNDDDWLARVLSWGPLELDPAGFSI